MIKFLDIQKYNKSIKASLMEATARVIDSGIFINGPEVNKFEKNFRRYIGSPNCITVANGLDALKIILRAWIIQGRLNPDDEVLVPSNTFIATVLAITENNLKPVFIEPDPDTHYMCAQHTKRAINSKTKLIIPVHLYGSTVGVSAIMDIANEHQLLVLEDAAQAHGAFSLNERAGNIGDAAAFSFYPGKNLGALGDAGAITTKNLEHAEICRALGNYGSEKKYHNKYIGLNSRMDEIQAAYLNIKLPLLDAEIEGRRAIARRYSSEIENPEIKLPVNPNIFESDAIEHVFHLYVIRSNKRDELKEFLFRHNIETLIHYPIAPHLQEAYRSYRSSSFPIAEQLQNEVLSIPIYSHLAKEEVSEVISAINKFN